MKKLFAFLMLASVLAFSGPAQAADDMAPDVLVKNVTNEVLALVKQDKEIKNGDTQRVIQLIEQKVLPHFDFTHMTTLAVGRDWRQATPDEQKALTTEFKNLLVRTYANAFTSYKNQTVTFKTLRMEPRIPTSPCVPRRPSRAVCRCPLITPWKRPPWVGRSTTSRSKRPVW